LLNIIQVYSNDVYYGHVTTVCRRQPEMNMQIRVTA